MADSPTVGQVAAKAANAGVDPTKAATIKAASPPPFMITPLKSEHRFIKILIYAKYGDGKTSLAASAVDVESMRDVIMVNAESGQMSVETAAHIPNRWLIDQVRVTDFIQVAKVQEFLKAHALARDAIPEQTDRLRKLQAKLLLGDDTQWESITDKGEGPYRLRRYRTVIVDSLTEIDIFSMYQLLGIKVDMKLDDEMEIANFPEFRKNNQMMQLLVRAYRDLNMNVILVSGSQYTQDEMKRMHYTPAMTGKLSGQVQGFVDIVGYLQTGKPDDKGNIARRLSIQPTGLFDAKSRLANYKESFIDQPTMTKIMDIFKSAKS